MFRISNYEKKTTTGGWGRAEGEPPAATSWGVACAPPQPPAVRLVGEADHADFRDAIALLQRNARLVDDGESPELVVVAQTRPDSISSGQLNSLRSAAPLAGFVALLGSWCEGETRTGRPWPGAHRLYWYELPAWWRRQMTLRATGRCPDWARPANFQGVWSEPDHPLRRPGLVVLHIPCRDTAEAIADELQRAGYSTVWQPPGRPLPFIRGAIAGIWDGAQLSDAEADQLSRFCREMSSSGASVLAILDFPRRDRVDLALQLGAVAVLAKPWLNLHLLSTLELIAADSPKACAA